MRALFIIILILFSNTFCFSQATLKSTSGEITFFSETPLENIDAISTKPRGLINTTSNEVAFVLSIIDFHFKDALMEEHFNENYMESEKYKTAYFKGKIIGNVDFKTKGEYLVKVKGILNIHGVDKEQEIEGKIKIDDTNLLVNSEFNILLKDFNIKIPKVVTKKIAEEVNVTVNINFNK